MTERPHQYTIRSSDDRTLAAAIIAGGSASGVELSAGADGTAGALHVQASDFGRFVHAVPALAVGAGVRLFEMSPANESLESVFAYLVER